MTSKFFKLSLLLALMAATPLQLTAQSADSTRATNQRNASRYFLGTEEQVLLPVNILGLVQKPGQYMVPLRTDLVSLIAFAGGFRDDAKVTGVKIIRRAGTNGTNHGRNDVYEVDVKRYFKSGDQTRIPQLLPDDTIVVSGSTRRTVNQIFEFLGKAAVLAQIYFYVKVALRE